jgi:hypothetical protein
MRWKSITCADAAPRHASDGHVIRVAARIDFRSVRLQPVPVLIVRRSRVPRHRMYL